MNEEVSKSKLAQIKKYGGEAGYRAEMKRRAGLRKTIGQGRQFNSTTAREAVRKRWGDGYNSSR